MRHLKKSLLFGAAAGIVLAGTAPAPDLALAQEAAVQEAPAKKLPKARDVLDRYLEAIGGRDAITSFTSSHTSGTFSVPSQNLSGNFDIYTADPDYGLMKVQISGIGQMTMGTGDGIAWSKDPMTGPMLLEGEQADQFADQADQRRALYLSENYKSMKVVDRVEFNGADCYKVELVRKSGLTSFEYFDAETGLMAGTESEQTTPMGKVPVVTTLTEYEQHGPVLVATHMSQKMMGMEQVMVLESVTFDEVDMEVFKLEPEIQALVDAKGKEKK